MRLVFVAALLHALLVAGAMVYLYLLVGEVYATEPSLRFPLLASVLVTAIPLPWLVACLLVAGYAWRAMHGETRRPEMLLQRVRPLLAVQAGAALLIPPFIGWLEDVGHIAVAGASLFVASLALLAWALTGVVSAETEAHSDNGAVLERR
ncbi:hypothetical protein [Actinomyces glycerinitolerans]|uniref:Uncharacterized protein n=1 Tax=Actinomyces glycerinitolerans TaxID=1892869 RepID=A0A1M4RX22_9ACTO|nr:hypothetical protein [Actinomyces glycerinitolerans]SHE24257.1 Hypothetical protein ACGLYG10_0457 [Actinomyces glycerinitolerans]